jgi:hypothetical protein
MTRGRCLNGVVLYVDLRCCLVFERWLAVGEIGGSATYSRTGKFHHLTTIRISAFTAQHTTTPKSTSVKGNIGTEKKGKLTAQKRAYYPGPEKGLGPDTELQRCNIIGRRYGGSRAPVASLQYRAKGACYEHDGWKAPAHAGYQREISGMEGM